MPNLYEFADGGEVDVQCMQVHNGYVYYSEIDDIIYVPSNLGIHGSPSQVEIYGQDFKITIVNANKSLIKKINIRMKEIEEDCHEPNTI